MMLAHWQSLAETLAGHLLNSVVEGVAIALFASLLLRTLEKQNSSARFALLLSTLGAVVAFPVMASLRPGSVAVRPTIHSALNLPGSWAATIVILWAVIAAAGLAKIALGFRQLQKLRRTCVPVNSEGLNAALLTTLRQFGGDRNVTLCTSDEVRVPTAIGFMNPSIVIPSWAFSELTPLELNAIVLHELAHLRRRDDWTNLALRIIRAVLFFHPAVWWLGRGLAREREMACDDFVLSATCDRRAYAQCLVSVAEKTFLRRSLALAQAFVGRLQLTAQRVARILAADRPVAVGVWKPAFGLVAAFSTVCMFALPRVPRLVTFDRADSGILAASLSSMHPTIMVPEAPEKNFGVKLIPASFNGVIDGKRVSAGAAKRTTVNKIASSKIALNKIERPDRSTLASAIVADSVMRPSGESQQSQTVEASFNSSASQPQAVLVVMQTDRVDEYGQVWSVCVWRLTVFHPSDKTRSGEVRKGIVPKST